ncbi:unnamed protein product [Rangifer tarandus platyrhynchus]|uniref:Uncharacterized protein n=1 Tax=Rangifer tarandus platyrhynchus TaxID=3082113 RepID=A0AC60A560_RANTA
MTSERQNHDQLRTTDVLEALPGLLGAALYQRDRALPGAGCLKVLLQPPSSYALPTGQGVHGAEETCTPGTTPPFWATFCFPGPVRTYCQLSWLLERLHVCSRGVAKCVC